MKYCRIFTLLILLLILAACNEDSKSIEGGLELHNINVQLKGNEIQLTAEADTALSEIYYVIEQGEEMVQDETVITLPDGEGVKEISLSYILPDEMKEKDEPPVIVIYGKSGDGEQIQPNYIPVDL